ncbi:MAG: GyrI-like domain-containing protein [Candidatus Methanomethylophilaceae archaeon]|jgi:effector-binding domain-containing protein
MEYTVTVRKIPSVQALTMEGKIQSYDEMEAFVRTASEQLLKENPETLPVKDGYRFISFPKMPKDGEPIELNFTIEVAGSGPGVHTVDGISAACTKHKGPWDEMGDAYSTLIRWMMANGYRATDAPREYYIKGPWETRNRHEWKTEIEMPIIPLSDQE